MSEPDEIRIINYSWMQSLSGLRMSLILPARWAKPITEVRCSDPDAEHHWFQFDDLRIQGDGWESLWDYYPEEPVPVGDADGGSIYEDGDSGFMSVAQSHGGIFCAVGRLDELTAALSQDPVLLDSGLVRIGEANVAWLFLAENVPGRPFELVEGC